MGDDRSIYTSGGSRTYHYSVSDGFRLLLATRKFLFEVPTTSASSVLASSSNIAKTRPGEEYSAYTENPARIFVSEPYHIDNFDQSLTDDIDKITKGLYGTKVWVNKPTSLVIPLIDGGHWRVVRITVNYNSQEVGILWDDPYGKEAFQKHLKSKFRQPIIRNLKVLLGIDDNKPLIIKNDRNSTGFIR